MPGWTEYGDSCYSKSYNQVDLNTAEFDCQISGSSISSINDQLELDFITTYASDILSTGNLWVCIYNKMARKCEIKTVF